MKVPSSFLLRPGRLAEVEEERAQEYRRPERIRLSELKASLKNHQDSNQLPAAEANLHNTEAELQQATRERDERRENVRRQTEELENLEKRKKHLESEKKELEESHRKYQES